MVKIENVDEVSRIIESNFGFIVETQDTINTIHETNCITISPNKFIDKTQRGKNFKFCWFSSIALAEKEFLDLKSCSQCKPN